MIYYELLNAKMKSISNKTKLFCDSKPIMTSKLPKIRVHIFTNTNKIKARIYLFCNIYLCRVLFP